jgi:outer membrane protein
MTPDPSDIEAWVEIAQSQNLSLIASRISANVADDDIRIARSSRFPVLCLSASGSDSGQTSSQTTNRFAGPDLSTPQSAFDRENESIRLSLSVPIFSAGSGSRIKQLVYRHRSAIQTVEFVTREIEQRTRDAYLAVTSGISRVEALRQFLDSSRTALAATLASEEVGRRTSADVVNAQNALRLAETRFAAARYDYLLDILRLKLATGSLTEADLLEIDGWLE